MTDARNTPAPQAPDFTAIYETALDEALKASKKVKVTKTHETVAERMVKAAKLSYQFELDARDPSSDLYDDPVWNHLHPLHKAVNGLIDAGLTTVEAIAEAQNGHKDPTEELADWLAEQTWSEFAQSLATQYRTKGFLSPKQVAAAKSMQAKVEARRAQQAEEEKAPVTLDVIDLSTLPSGYYAVPGGDTRLKVRIAHGKPGTKWEGWTFVSDGAEYGQRTNYGSQRPGQAYQGKIRDALKAIVAEPFEAQAAYGKLTGTCGACGRHLEDETSIALGIGPICRNKWEAA